MKFALMYLGGMVLLFSAFVELILLYPMAWWAYAASVALFSAGVWLGRKQMVKPLSCGLLMVFWLAAATLYLVEWSTRKPFLRDLARVRPGMTEEQVRLVMGGHKVGTGWPLPPWSASADAEQEQLTVPGSLVFRHSDDGRFNSDWGIVKFAQGKVVAVDFSAD